MGKFKIDEWVYTYDEQGLVYKHQVRGNVGVFYALTGKSEPVNTQYVFKTKKECLKAMKDAGIQKASLHMVTVIKLENKVADLEAKLAESERKREEIEFSFDMETNSHKEEIEFFSKQVKSIQKENKQLKQQLAEKDAEVQSWKDGTMVVKLCELEKQLAEKEKEETKRMEDFEKRCQEYYSTEEYKRDFAIAKLEKAKKLLDGYKWFQGENEYSFVDDYAVDWSDVIKIFDQQIKSLKGDADGSTN